VRQRLQFVVWSLVLAVMVVLGVAKWSSGLYTDWLWFGSLHYRQVFLTILFTELGLRLAVGVLVFVVLFVNLMFTRRSILAALGTPLASRDGEDGVVTLRQSPLANFLGPRTVTWTFFLLSVVLGFFLSFTVSGSWVVLQKFLHPTPFNVTDPVFGLDISFYVFKLPFYTFIYQFLLWLTVLVAFWVGLVYFLLAVPRGPGAMFRLNAARYHLSALALVFFLVKAWGYRLDQFMLLFSQEGMVYGPGYTDLHAVLPGLWILLVVSLLCAAAVVTNLFVRQFRLVPLAVGFLVAASVVFLNIYPALVQKFVVAPNEFDKEKPYIERSIAFTRAAYDLNDITAQDFPATGVLTGDELAANQSVVNSIRLWDEGPLQATYNQIQTMRLYYTFPQIDVDRYTLNGQYRQVLLGVREIDQTQLPDQARTWINEKLKYTHGYGVAMSPVNEFTTDGLPRFYLKNIPPESDTDLQLTNPAIYYGQDTNGYVVVDTNTPEFDYPKGDDNAYTTYRGDGGVAIGNAWRRLLFAFSFADYKLLFSGDISNSSRLLYYRNISQRVPKLAPFLRFDRDPYPVVANGKVYWMWDAYTETDMYPYSEPFGDGNDYMRNPVKVVVDAYTGDVNFYVSDPTDPLIQTWSRIFPGMFQPLSQMPAALRAHIRYPLDYFTVQARMYATYHMTDPQVFYNKEDKWSMPTDTVQQQPDKTVQPYYIITRLPGQPKAEYVLILPFTPQNKQNMVAWLAARMDPPNYGKLVVYEFPKQQVVYGPQQIDALIDQNTTISAQLTLWNQQGSKVIRGNLMVIPIDNAILYVEPLYLQAQQSKMPELARVIAISGNNIAMEPTLGDALNQLFHPSTTSGGGTLPAPATETLTQLIQKANQVYDEAQKQLQAGNWAGYGDDLRQLKEILDELSQKTQGNAPGAQGATSNAGTAPGNLPGGPSAQ